MNESMQAVSLIIMLVGAMVVAGIAIKALCVRLGVPALIGYFALGFALRVADARLGLLSPAALNAFEFLANAGVVVLLFRVGLESDLGKLIRQIPRATLIWAGNVVLSGVLGFVVAVHVVGLALIPSLFVATALTATSVAVSVAVWRDAGALRSDNGALLLDVAEMDDISAVVLMAMLLAVAPALASGDGAALASAVGATAGLLLAKLAGFGAFCVAFSRYAERRLTELFARLEHRPAPMLMVAGTGFIIAAIAGWLGFSLALGALFAGLVFSLDPRALNIDVSFGSLYEFFMPFFFIGIGLKVDPASLGAGAEIAAALLAVAVLGKVVGAGGPALVSTGWPGATLIGISMVPRAEIALVIMHQGHALGDWAVSDDVFGAMVIVSIATCVLAPLALKPLLQRWPQAAQG